MYACIYIHTYMLFLSVIFVIVVQRPNKCRQVAATAAASIHPYD